MCLQYKPTMDALFGSQVRTDTLVAIARLGTTYTGELAEILGRQRIEIRRALASLERSGVIVTRLIGRTRIVELNRTYKAADELYALLLKASEFPEYERRWRNAERRRPRAIGKPR